jgi:hypothetical protein
VVGKGGFACTHPSVVMPQSPGRHARGGGHPVIAAWAIGAPRVPFTLPPRLLDRPPARTMTPERPMTAAAKSGTLASLQRTTDLQVAGHRRAWAIGSTEGALYSPSAITGSPACADDDNGETCEGAPAKPGHTSELARNNGSASGWARSTPHLVVPSTAARRSARRRMERSAIRDRAPDIASLHPGCENNNDDEYNERTMRPRHRARGAAVMAACQNPRKSPSGSSGCRCPPRGSGR